MRWWKVVGLAGLAGVAATGVAVARSERRRRAYPPEEIRARLHARIDEAGYSDAGGAPPPGPAGSGTHTAPTGRPLTGRAAALRAGAADRTRAAYRQVADRVRTARPPGRHRNT